MPERILILDPIHPHALRELKQRFAVHVALQPSERDLLRLVEDADVIVLRSGVKLTRAIVQSAKKLRVIARAGAGVDNIDVVAARERGITVFNVPGESSNTVAEFTIGLILALVRKIAFADRQMRDGLWNKDQLCGIELRGKKLGIVGLGKIGMCVAALGRAFEMSVMGCVANPTEERRLAMAKRDVYLADLPDVLTTSDVVSLHLPLTDASRNCISARELRMMKRSAFLVNVSRGEVVDEEAILNALRGGIIAGAAMDVFAQEGRPTQLIEIEGVLLTPHIGAMTFEAQERVGQILVDAIIRSLGSEQVPNRIC